MNGKHKINSFDYKANDCNDIYSHVCVSCLDWNIRYPSAKIRYLPCEGNIHNFYCDSHSMLNKHNLTLT